MTAQRLFRHIWRFNAIAIAIAACLAILLGLFALREVTKSLTRTVNVRSVTPATPSSPNAPELALSGFTWLQPGRVLWSPLTTAQSYRYGGRAKASTSVRNYLFFDVEQNVTTRLLPDENALIVAARQLRFGPRQEAEPLRQTRPGYTRRGQPPLRALLITRVTKDTDGDGLITARDKPTLGIAGPDGRGHRVLDLAIDKLLSVSMIDAQTALLLVRTLRGFEAVRISLPAGDVTRRDVVAKLSTAQP
ncbi:MAG: hypothetical protein AAFR04_08220 [Pseudomonadota bacterium]